MTRIALLFLTLMSLTTAADLPTRKYLNLAAIKTLVATAEAEAAKRNVQVTLCIMDESGNLLFLQKADGATLNTIQFAQKKARYAALYGRPSKVAADQLSGGNTEMADAVLSVAACGYARSLVDREAVTHGTLGAGRVAVGPDGMRVNQRTQALLRRLFHRLGRLILGVGAEIADHSHAATLVERLGNGFRQ